MNIFLTGATGYLGSAVLSKLQEDGHTVTALVRNKESADKIRSAGARPVLGTLGDASVLSAAASAADGVIHTASPGDATSADLDDRATKAFLSALAGSDKPYLHTSGAWIYGNTDGVIAEDAPLAPPALTQWRLPIEERVRAATADGVRAIVIGPGIVYGHGAGLPNLIVGAPRTPAGELQFPGPGDQHWVTIFVEDAAALYVAALTRGEGGAYYHAASGTNPTVRELAVAASKAAGLDGAVTPEPFEQTQARLGPLAEALLLDQQASGARARADLGWEPTGPSLLDELSTGSYAPVS